MNAEQLVYIMPELSGATYDHKYYVPYVNKTMEKFGINTRLRQAAFLAIIAYESGQLQYWREIGGDSMWYSPYYGRGPIQLTHYDNYALCGNAIGVDLASNPDLVASDTQVGMDSAGWFWRNGNGDLNDFADEGDFWSCYLRVLGSDNGSYPERKAFYDKALNTLDGVKMVGIEEIMAKMDLLRGASYRWWDGQYPFTPGTAMYADGSGHSDEDGWAGKYSVDYIMREGVNCVGLLNWARMECGLDPIGGTGHWYDWLWDNSEWFDPSTPGERGAVVVHQYEEGISEGHIAVFVDDQYLIQSESTNGVWAGEHQVHSNNWAGYQLYAKMPDVDYSGAKSDVDITENSKPYMAIDSDYNFVYNGHDWSKGWWWLNL